jgi:hypothetical protein
MDAVDEEDRRLFSGDVCKLLGIAASTWRAYVARGQAPAADGTWSPDPAWAARPFWWASTIETWRAERRRGAKP